MSKPLTYSQIFSRAWPIILANAAIPILGLVDTAIIGNTGNTQELGAIALGALIFNFVYWSFGFLRMGTTGFTAQAAGAKHWLEVRLVLGRALLIAFALAVILLVFHRWLGNIIFHLFQASEGVEAEANNYFNIRILGAPATLGTFALLGILVGLGKSRQLLWVQLCLNGLNIALDIYFAGFLAMGVEGIAIGTVIAEYSTFIFGSIVVYRVLKQHWQPEHPFWSWREMVDKTAMLKVLNANSDIMIRTVLLVFSFAWFTNAGAQFGDTILSANHVLLQFVSFSAFFLDGYAFVAESIVGSAVGAKQRRHFDLGVWRSTVLATFTAVVLAGGTLVLGNFIIGWLTDIHAVRETAGHFLWLACVYILLSVGAFQLDGIFIGALHSRAMRNAAIVSTGGFLLLSLPLIHYLNNTGLWLAFIAYVGMRAVALAYYYPRLRGGLMESAKSIQNNSSTN